MRAIPANDDAIKGIHLLLDYVSQAIAEGKGASKVETTEKTEEK